MKRVNKISSLISAFIIAWLIGLFNFLYTNKVSNFLTFIHDTLREELYFFEHSKIYIAIFIFASIFIFLSVISFLMNIYSDEKIKKLLQSIIFYVNLACLLTIVILLLVVYLKNYHILSIISSNEEVDDDVFELLDIEYTLYGKLFIFLLLQGISNVILSVLSLYYLKEDMSEMENSDNQKDNSGNNIVKNELIKEMNKMKAELEIKELKEEYKSLYIQLNGKPMNDNILQSETNPTNDKNTSQELLNDYNTLVDDFNNLADKYEELKKKVDKNKDKSTKEK